MIQSEMIKHYFLSIPSLKNMILKNLFSLSNNFKLSDYAVCDVTPSPPPNGSHRVVGNVVIAAFDHSEKVRIN